MPPIQTTEVVPVELQDEKRIQTIEVKRVQDEQPSAVQVPVSLVEVKYIRI